MARDCRPASLPNSCGQRRCYPLCGHCATSTQGRLLLLLLLPLVAAIAFALAKNVVWVRALSCFPCAARTHHHHPTPHRPTATACCCVLPCGSPCSPACHCALLRGIAFSGSPLCRLTYKPPASTQRKLGGAGGFFASGVPPLFVWLALWELCGGRAFCFPYTDISSHTVAVYTPRLSQSVNPV